MADDGTGTTITFGTSGFTAEILSVEGPGYSREAIDTTHMGTTTAKTFMPADLYDGGEVSLEIAYDPDDTPPITAVAETITVTSPIPAGLSNGATRAFSGFVTAFSPSHAIGERMTASITIKVAGAITPAAAS